MPEYTQNRAKLEIAEALSGALGTKITIDDIKCPPPNIAGDFAFPCFALARTQRKNPMEISRESAEKISFSSSSVYERVESSGGYLNFFFNRESFCNAAVHDFLSMRSFYGRSDKGAGKQIIIDYSSPNIAKPFSIGHLRSTNIGSALCNLLRFIGYEVIGDNHIGDWGTQFGKLIYAYRHWGNRETIEANPIQELLSLYIRFHEEAERVSREMKEKCSEEVNPLEEEARRAFKMLEEGDAETVRLWQWIRDLSLKEFEHVYGLLGITFEEVLGESFYNDKMSEIKDMLDQKGLLERDEEGTLLVRLDSYGITTPLLIQKRDGSSLYATRDLACAIYRIRRWNPSRIIYAVGEEQQLYFRQVFKVLELLGHSTRCDHVYFGLIMLPEGKIATRKGRVIFLEDVIDQAVKEASHIIEGREWSEERKAEVSKVVGLGAIKYHDLSQNRKKTVTFDWDKMLSLEGNSSPYLQYSYARARSILRKAGTEPRAFTTEGVVLHDEEVNLVKKLARFPETVEEAAETCYPHILAGYLYELAVQFSTFYNTVPVLASKEQKERDNRLILLQFYSHVMKEGLGLLGISTLEEM